MMVEKEGGIAGEGERDRTVCNCFRLPRFSYSPLFFFLHTHTCCHMTQAKHMWNKNKKRLALGSIFIVVFDPNVTLFSNSSH